MYVSPTILCAHYGQETTIHCVPSMQPRLTLISCLAKFPMCLSCWEPWWDTVQSCNPDISLAYPGLNGSTPGWFGTFSWSQFLTTYFSENLSKFNDCTYTCPLSLSYCFSPAYLVIASPFSTSIKFQKTLLCFIFNQITVYRLVWHLLLLYLYGFAFGWIYHFL